MHSWPAPYLPAADVPTPPRLRLFDSATGQVTAVKADDTAYMYVCGVTPYDAAHLGHAFTYVFFDVVQRYLRVSGTSVRYVQNVTDVDDPLLERALATGVRWEDLAASEIETFRSDMTALSVIPPDALVSVVDSVPDIADAVWQLVQQGAAYAVKNPDLGSVDYYADLNHDAKYDHLLELSLQHAIEIFAERGGDPGRRGKRSALDPLLWRAQRPGEPSWEHAHLGAGRPGWHIECSVIMAAHGQLPLTIQGGGRDLAFPHHPMSLSHARCLHGSDVVAHHHVHTAMVGLNGEKMSKSKGNLVFVHQLLAQDVVPAVVRLALLSQHYRADWQWSEQVLKEAEERFVRWQSAFARPCGVDPAGTIAQVLAVLSDDVQVPLALECIDEWVQQHESSDEAEWVPGAAGRLSRFVDAVLGVRF